MGSCHPTIQRLYDAAKEVGDLSPASVALRLNISAQTLNNWASRGISLEGALSAQMVYGTDAGWLLTGDRSPRRTHTAAEGDRNRHVTFNPTWVAETYQALWQTYDAAGKKLDLGEEFDAARFVHMYSLRAAMSSEPTRDELIDYGRKLQIIFQGSKSGGSGDSVPAEGDDSSRVAK